MGDRERRRGKTFPDGYDPEATRAALLESGLKLFGERGFAATSIQEITSRVGVTKGAFYHHFENKEDLLRLIHDEFVDALLVAMDRVLGADSDPVRQIRQLLVEFLASASHYREHVTVFFQERRYLTGERFTAVMEKRDRFERIFDDVIERGVAAGAFRDDLDARIVGFGLLGMCAWTYQWYRPGGTFSAEDIAVMFADMALDGLTPR